MIHVHELSIAISLIEVAEQEARRRGAKSVASIRVRLGPLSGVMKEALISAYGLAREETVLAKAELIVHETPIRLYCQKCVAERDAQSMQMLCCAVCGEPSNEIVSGARAGDYGDGDRDMTTRLVEVRQKVLKQNDVVARAMRERFHEQGTFVVSLVSSPGSGKTAFLEKLLAMMKEKYRVAALVGDLATDNDAKRLARGAGRR